jgi:hypothetical protein
MLLTPRYSIVSAPIKDYTDFAYADSDDDDDRAEHPYLSVGHGDFSEEHGYDPRFVVWAIINGRLQASEVTEPGIGITHGSIWGHDVTDRDYKGRYEPQTGRLTIVKPQRLRFREIPDVIMRQLESKFKNITEIRVF